MSELNAAVENRCQRYLSLAEDAGKSMEMELKVQMVKLPKKVLWMSSAEDEQNCLLTAWSARETLEC